jgi:hypothetical protein
MGVEFKAVEAIDSLVALLRVAEDSAVHSWEQHEPFHPGIFPGLILLARFAAERAGTDHKLALVKAEQIRQLKESCADLEYVTTDRDGYRDGLHELKKEFDQLQQQLAQVTTERDDLKKLSTQINPALLHELVNAFEGCDPATIREKLLALDGKGFQLSQEVGELPAPEPDEWQIGDEIECNGVTRRKVIDRREGWVFLEGVTSPLSQPDWELRRWKLHRKAADLPDIAPFTPQQVEAFAAVAEPIDDSTGADGEGQS